VGDLVSNDLWLANQLEKNTFVMGGDRQAGWDDHSRMSLLLTNVLSWCVVNHSILFDV